jgi:hypothetical protein
MTTEIQLTDKELEAAGHKLCEIRGIGPYMPVGLTPAFKIAASEIKNFIEIVQAIDHVKGIE